MLQILQQAFLCFIFLHFGTVVVRILESKLDGQSAINSHAIIGSHAGSILWYKDMQAHYVRQLPQGDAFAPRRKLCRHL